MLINKSQQIFAKLAIFIFTAILFGLWTLLFSNITFAAPPCNPVPALISISPVSAVVGSSKLTLSVNGTNFISNSKVQFNGINRPTSFVSDTQLTASILADDLVTVGAFPVTVVNNPPCGGTSSAVNFIVKPLPIVGGGAGAPTEVHFTGRAYPGAKLTFIAKNIYQDIPFSEEITASSSGNFKADFVGILAGPQLWGVVVKDKEERAARPQYYNMDTQSDLLQTQNLFLPPTLGFKRTIITKGDFLALIGYAAPGSKIEIQIDGQTLKENATAQSDGSYKLLFNTAELNFLGHTAKSRQTDENGNLSDFSSEAIFTVSNLFVPEADLNRDGIIDIKDASIFLSLWKSKDPAAREKIDFDNDGAVDIADFAIFIRNLHK